MDNHILELLDRAHGTIHQAQQCLFAKRAAKVITIPDLYPVMGNLVELTRALCEFLETLPDLTTFDPAEHDHSEGLDPREVMASAEAALGNARVLADALDPTLNKGWSRIARLGVKND